MIDIKQIEMEFNAFFGDVRSGEFIVFKKLLAECKRLHEELQEMLDDFQNLETDKWKMRNRIETILKGDEEE